jgi:hypothetical protein
MKWFLLIIVLFCISCAPVVIWSINSCEVSLVSKCQSFCKLNRSKAEEFVKTTQYHQCVCQKEMEAKFYNACE